MALQLMTLSALIYSSYNIYSSTSKLITRDDLDAGAANVNMVARKFGFHEQRLSHSINDAIQKKFGTIYYNNKVVLYDPDTHIIEIRMTMGTATETAYDGYHVVRLAIYNPQGVLYDSLKDLYKEEISKKKDKRRGGPGVDTQGDMRRLRKSMEGQKIEDGNLPGGPNAEQYEIDFTEEDGPLKGWIIPVADTSQASFGQSFGESEKVFLLKEAIDWNSLVRVSCSCSDYYYTISPYNYKEGVHLGPKPTFPVPAPKKAKRNVDKQPGLCKHLSMMAVLLLNGGILKGVGSGQINNWRNLIVNRAEHLVMPQKLTDENELRRMYAGVNDTVRAINYDRKTEAQLRQDFRIFKSVQSRENYIKNVQNGTANAIGAGISYDNMRKTFVTKADMYNNQMKELASRIDSTKRALKGRDPNKYTTDYTKLIKDKIVGYQSKIKNRYVEKRDEFKGKGRY